MEVLAIKGEMHELISKIKDECSAEALLKIIREFIKTSILEADPDMDKVEKSMTAEEVAAIKRALSRSYDHSNYLSSEEAEKNFPNG